MIVDFNRNEINKIITSLRSDPYLRDEIVIKEKEIDSKGTGENRTEKMFYIELSYALINSIGVIKSFSLDEIVYPNRHKHLLREEKEALDSLRENVNTVFNNFAVPFSIYSNNSFYRRLIFVIKYFSIKNFFSKNYYKFLPAYDYMNIQKSDKSRLFTEALMKQFDRFASIIEDIASVSDIDSIPAEYINYLAQLVGYQKDIDESLFNYITFREFIKNVIDVYRIKGTSYSIELFFGFIGFSVEISELWFDRRFYYLGSNKERNTKDNKTFNYYLTKIDPRSRVLGGYQVLETELIGARNLYTFERSLREETGADKKLKELLGVDSSYGKDQYTYFKTNIITIDATPYSPETEIDEVKQTLIQSYIKFLIPVFIQNYTNYMLLEPISSSEKINDFYLYDLDKINYNVWSELGEYGKGDIVQLDLIVYKKVGETNGSPPGENSVGWEIVGRTNDFLDEDDPEYMVHTHSDIFPSGFYNGTTKKIDSWDFSKGDKSNLESLKILQRDVIKPFREDPTDERSEYSYFLGANFETSIFMNNNFSYLKGNVLRNSKVYDNNTYYDIIKGIDVTTNEIKILKNIPYAIGSFSSGDIVEVYTTTLSNRGNYTVLSIREEGSYIYIKVEEPLKEDQLVEGGTLNKYHEDWLYTNFTRIFMEIDSIEWVKQE